MEPIARDGRGDRSRPSSSTAADRDRAVATACDRLGIDSPQARAAVARAYEVGREYLAPVVVKAAVEMLDDIRSELARDPATRVVFLGRNGGSLERAIGRLDPELVARSCSLVVLSRRVMERALQDRERESGTRFEGIDAFRGKRAEVAEEEVSDSWQRLDDHLDDNQVPIRAPGGSVILIDSSYKGTVQENLTALYPETSFRGSYLFFGAHPEDPHPGTKQGYALHLTGDQSAGVPVDRMPDDARHTFACQDAIAVIEDTLHGTRSSPKEIGPDGAPDQQPMRSESEPLRGLNPLRVDVPYRDPAVREAVKEVALVAVADAADRVRIMQDSGQDSRSELARTEASGRSQIRGWVTGGGCDPALATVLDSFVRRGDKRDLAELSDLLREHGLPADRSWQIWQDFDQLDHPEQRRQFIDTLRRRSDTLADADRLASSAEGLRRRSERLGQVPGQRRADDDRDDPLGRRHEPPTDDRRTGREGPTLRR